jgi:hypothetical protein
VYPAHPVHASRERGHDRDQVLDQLVLHRPRCGLPGNDDGSPVAGEIPPQVLEPEPGEPVLERDDDLRTCPDSTCLQSRARPGRVVFNPLLTSVNTAGLPSPAFAQLRVAVATCLPKSPFAFCSCDDTRQYTAVPVQASSPPCDGVLNPWHSMVAKAIRR